MGTSRRRIRAALKERKIRQEYEASDRRRRQAEEEYNEARARLIMNLPQHYGPEIWDADKLTEQLREFLNLASEHPSAYIFLTGSQPRHDPAHQPPWLIKARGRDGDHPPAEQLDV